MTKKKLLRALKGELMNTPPIWLMRQAGRYLPEYRQVKEKAGAFLNLCYTPKYAVEVTLQPIRRYGFDAAILFSDLTLIAQGLGQKLWYEDGGGPRLDPIRDAAASNLPKFLNDGGHLFCIGRLLTERIPDEPSPPWPLSRVWLNGRFQMLKQLSFSGFVTEDTPTIDRYVAAWNR